MWTKYGKFKILMIVMLSIMLIVFCAFILSGNEKVITIEAGSDIPDITEFIDDEEAVFVTELSSIDTKVPGVYNIEIKTEDKTIKSKLKIEDTIKPVADLREQEIPLGDTVEAEDFVENIEDVTEVKVAYLEEPDFEQIGEQEVSLIIEDAGKNKTELTASLYIGKVHKSVDVEIGTKQLSTSQFMMSKDFKGTFVTDISTLDFNSIGKKDIILSVDNDEYTTQVNVIDTVPPKADIVNQITWEGEPIKAKEFVENIEDNTSVSVRYKEQPDFSKIGDQIINIILEDEGGNKTEYESQLTVQEDLEPPVIEGAYNQTVYIGDRVSYRKNVTVSDNKDDDIELVIDSSAVNLKTAGTYEVVYSATDSSGNKTTKTVEIVIKEKPEGIDIDELHSLADTILESIINEDMTDKEKLWAIFNWTNTNIKYIGYSDKSDWMKGANQGLKSRKGDCFNYYATSRLLLTNAGFENLPIERVDGTHFWNLVKYEGEWYHFDASPYRTGYRYVCFLRTDAEVEEYSEWCIDFFKFDESNYPRTPETPLEIDR
ncbi:MAG: immunoglobulin-like domain-containing protein [Eubacteriales bacterium]